MALEVKQRFLLEETYSMGLWLGSESIGHTQPPPHKLNPMIFFLPDSSFICIAIYFYRSFLIFFFFSVAHLKLLF